MRLLGAAFGLAFVLAFASSQPANADGIGRTYALSGQPRTIAIDPADGRVFVANNAAPRGFVSVIEPTSGQVTDHPTSGVPNALAIDSTHRRLYVANYNHTVDVFDLTTMALVTTLPIYGVGLTVDATTQRVYVAGATDLTVVDGVTNTVVATRPALAGEDWFSVGVDPALHRVFVTNFFNWPPDNVFPSLIVLDDRDLSIITELLLPVQPRWGLAVDQQRHRVYVAGPGTSATNGALPQLIAFDGASLAQIGSAAVPGDPEGIAIGSDQVYVASLVTGYTVVDATTFAVTQSVSTLPVQPFQPAVDADGRLYLGVFAGGGGPNAVVAISTGNHPPVIGAASLYPTVPTTTDVLQFFVSAIDGDFAVLPAMQRDPVTVVQEWARNGTQIPGEAAPSLDLSRAGLGDRGDTITARVTVTDPQGLVATASASVVVANALPVLTVSLSSTTPGTNDVVTANAVATDADGDPVTVTYEWLRNSVVIPGATTASLDLAVQGDPGDNLVVRVTASDGQGGVQVAAKTAIVVPSAGSFLSLNSEPGDYVGAGLQQLFIAPNPSFQAWLLPGGDTFRADIGGANWGVVVSAPVGVPLAVGSYTGAARSPFRPAGSPGLDVTGDHRGCNTLTGKFTVSAIAYSQYDELMLFDASFEQHCEGAVPALFGRIHVEIPPPTPGVTLPVGSIAVPTSGSYLYMNSQGGDYIGQGREQLYSWGDSGIYGALPLGGSNFSGSVVQGNAHWWSVDIRAPQGEPLGPGSYIRAARAPFQPAGLPGLSVNGDGRACNTLTGKFDINELSFSPRGDLLVFQATFEQHCEGVPNALFGRIRIENPTSSPGVTLPPGAITVPTSGTFLYVNSAPGESVGNGAEQLYTVANSSLTSSFSDGNDYFRGSAAQGGHTWSLDIASPQGPAPSTITSNWRSISAFSLGSSPPGAACPSRCTGR